MNFLRIGIVRVNCSSAGVEQNHNKQVMQLKAVLAMTSFSRNCYDVTKKYLYINTDTCNDDLHILKHIENRRLYITKWPYTIQTLHSILYHMRTATVEMRFQGISSDLLIFLETTLISTSNMKNWAFNHVPSVLKMNELSVHIA